MADEDPLLGRSVKTLAWLGDAAFEHRIRTQVARRGDYPIDRLDAIKGQLVRADAQAQLLEAIEAELTEAEEDVVRRGTNTSVSSTPRGRRSTQAYRRATGFEVLVAYWTLTGVQGQSRWDAVLQPRLDAAIDDAVAQHSERPRRG